MAKQSKPSSLLKVFREGAKKFGVEQRQARKQEKTAQKKVSKIQSIGRAFAREAFKEFRRTTLPKTRRGRSAELELFEGMVSFSSKMLAIDDMVHLHTGGHSLNRARQEEFRGFLMSLPESSLAQDVLKSTRDRFETELKRKKLVPRN